ncbi:MAG: repressor LexA [Planctomycetota bacterium]|jgi:repressor LexA
MRPLTKNQERVMDYLRKFIDEKGFAPTQAEIAKGLGFRSANGAAEHLRLLAKKDVISLTPGIARSIRLTDDSDASSKTLTDQLFVIGQVAAGQPILAEENIETSIAVSSRLFKPRADYLLRVRGVSMIDRGICDRDLVAVAKTSRIKNGDIAVVRLDDEVTVKTWRRRGSKVILEPANAEFQDIVIDPKKQDIHVEGRVVGLLRLEMGKHA